jgi:hypothetical protein
MNVEHPAPLPATLMLTMEPSTILYLTATSFWMNLLTLEVHAHIYLNLYFSTLTPFIVDNSGGGGFLFTNGTCNSMIMQSKDSFFLLLS